MTGRADAFFLFVMNLFINTPTLTACQKARLTRERPDDELYFKTDLSEREQAEAFRRADIIFGNPPVAWWQTIPENLKFWQLDSVGFEYYVGLMPGVPVCNVGDLFARPCAETMIAGILALYRHIDQFIQLRNERRWIGYPIRFTMSLLRDKSVVILGAGAISQTICQLLQGFGCQIQTLARTNPLAELHSVEELKAVLPTTDIIINCLPGTAKGFFNQELISAMKPGGVFANVGRGSTVDEVALIDALKRGNLSGAILDVTTIEPLPDNHPFWGMPQVILTQHTGGGHIHEDDDKIDLFTENLRRFMAGESLTNQIDLNRGY